MRKNKKKKLEMIKYAGLVTFRNQMENTLNKGDKPKPTTLVVFYHPLYGYSWCAKVPPPGSSYVAKVSYSQFCEVSITFPNGTQDKLYF